jgi:hypothetical protein
MGDRPVVSEARAHMIMISLECKCQINAVKNGKTDPPIRTNAGVQR